MSKLLNANFYKLRKGKIFWILMIFSIVLAIFMIYTSYSDMKTYGDVIQVEQLMLNYSTIIGIVIAIFTSLYLGVEYSDGAIRNKICIGHKRTNIYLSNFITTTLTILFSYIVFLILINIIGIPLFGKITISLSILLKLIGCIFVTIIAYSSIFTFISMVISNKTIIAIVSIMLSFGLMMCALTSLNVLATSEYYQAGTLVDGEMKFEMVKNPKYPTEEEKKVHQTLLDINPAGQMYQIAGWTAVNLEKLPIYSLGIIVIFSTSGILLFRKKQLQ